MWESGDETINYIIVKLDYIVKLQDQQKIEATHNCLACPALLAYLTLLTHCFVNLTISKCGIEAS